jgi:hypothetical protein
VQLFLGSRPKRPLRPVENHDHRTKPGRGGLWTSDWRADIGSAWAWSCAGEFGDKYATGQGWLLRPDSGAVVYEVDDMLDLRLLQHRYPRFPGTPYEGGFRWPTSRPGFEVWCPSLAWPAVARDYDAVRLTEKGWCHLGEHQGPLRDWDVASTIWFRWCFTNQPTRITWSNDVQPRDPPERLELG